MAKLEVSLFGNPRLREDQCPVIAVTRPLRFAITTTKGKNRGNLLIRSDGTVLFGNGKVKVEPPVHVRGQLGLVTDLGVRASDDASVQERSYSVKDGGAMRIKPFDETLRFNCGGRLFQAAEVCAYEPVEKP